MPITPFHMGPALAVKAVTGRWFSLLVFGLSQVLIDIEPLVGLIRGSAVLHGPSHTLAGAAVIAIVAAEAGRPLSGWWLRVWTGERVAIARGVAYGSAFVGTYSHLLLDGMMHLDMAPFAPLTDANPLLGAMSVPGLYAFCVVTGIVGAAVVLRRRRPA